MENLSGRVLDALALVLEDTEVLPAALLALVLVRQASCHRSNVLLPASSGGRPATPTVNGVRSTVAEKSATHWPSASAVTTKPASGASVSHVTVATKTGVPGSAVPLTVSAARSIPVSASAPTMWVSVRLPSDRASVTSSPATTAAPRVSRSKNGEALPVDLVPVKTETQDGALARYLGKIQLEMTRQDLKTARWSTSRSPWQIGLDAADTGDARDTARWVEYLHATKGRNVVTQSQSLKKLYGEPTDKEIDAMLGIEDHTDDQADEHDQGQDMASIDAAVWNDARHIITPATGSLIAAALTAMENHGLQGPQRVGEVARFATVGSRLYEPRFLRRIPGRSAYRRIS